MEPKKCVVIVSHTFWPDSNPRSIRLKELSLALLRQNTRVISLSRFGIQDHKEGDFTSNPTTIPPPKYKKESALKKRLKNTAKKFIWPDYAFMWVIPAAIRLGRMLATLETNVRIFSSSNPMSSHLCVLLLKKLRLIKSPWICEFSDPFSVIPNHKLNNEKLYRKLNRCFEKAVLESCDKITVTTHNTRLLYIQNFPELSSKFHVVPPVFPTSTTLTPLPLPGQNYKAERFLFAGTLYRGLRSPELVIEFADYLKTHSANYEIYFVGNTKEYDDILCAQQNISLIGKVSHDLISRYLLGANALINIGNTSELQLPSKVAEYISYRKFIFNFISSSNDTSISFLEEYPAHANIRSSADFPLALEKYLTNKDNNILIEKAANHYQNKYSIDNLVKAICHT